MNIYNNYCAGKNSYSVVDELSPGCDAAARDAGLVVEARPPRPHLVQHVSADGGVVHVRSSLAAA